MKALRLILHQNKAHYRKEHSWKNRLTYPLPPASTIIGALHTICDWKEYHPMNLSIQGRYQSVNNEIHNRHIYQDNTMDDRGFLVKVCDGDIMYGRPIIISESLKQGSSHTNQIDTIVHNKELLEEYKSLKEKIKNLNAEKKEKENAFKTKLSDIKDKKNTTDKNSDEYQKITLEEKQAKEEKESVLYYYKNELSKVENEISKYKVMVKTLQNEEVLSNVDLIIYVTTVSKEDLDTIFSNIYKLEHLGRTEDAVNITDASLVDLSSCEDYCNRNNESEIYSYENYISYIKQDMIFEKNIFTSNKTGIDMGTVYYVNKDYKILDNKRVFNKITTLLVSNYSADEDSDNVWIDTINNNPNIVTFI